MDPKNEKGLFLFGQVTCNLRAPFFDLLLTDFVSPFVGTCGHLYEPEEAKKHFEAVLQFDSNIKAATNQMVIFKRKIFEQRETDKKLYSSIFNNRNYMNDR
jgi:FK506-binding protein 4/5